MEELIKDLSNTLNMDIHTVYLFAKGQIDDIYKVGTPDSKFILKTSYPTDNLVIEAHMIIDINKYHIRIPKVYDVYSIK